MENSGPTAIDFRVGDIEVIIALRFIARDKRVYDFQVFSIEPDLPPVCDTIETGCIADYRRIKHAQRILIPRGFRRKTL